LSRDAALTILRYETTGICLKRGRVASMVLIRLLPAGSVLWADGGIRKKSGVEDGATLVGLRLAAPSRAVDTT